MDKAQLNDVTSELRLCENVEAPVEQGQKLGEMVISVGGQEQQTIPIVADRGRGTADPSRYFLPVPQNTVYGGIIRWSRGSGIAAPPSAQSLQNARPPNMGNFTLAFPYMS